EDELLCALAESRPRVPHGYVDGLDLGAFRAHGDHPPVGGTLGHRLHGVEEEIEDDLLQLNSVSAHEQRIRVELQPDLDVANDRIAAQELGHVPDQAVEVENADLDFTLSKQAAEAPDHLRRALVVVNDVRQRAADLGEIGWGRLQQAQSGSGVRQGSGQRLVQLV